ncbi:hypothetical protein SSABA_v1c09350 [Spiroplasma sabaudiense Ar-1343]|uniref:R3H domain-containing protein n=1 Tax=Spiroplasma sabaudiense Ar-1343 TaxID=1276257 RepID=W6AAY1_9MOLU|nr:R3H domain-containing nucleic acid-binding protein [Spiroplasma sabaudiense]AHI54333.1 hypothetical protein SSABA_v1c09350 [Spiroplasma sabaudiense Ar-1343]
MIFKKKITYDYKVIKTRSFLGLKFKRESGFDFKDLVAKIKNLFNEPILGFTNLKYESGKLEISSDKIDFTTKDELPDYNLTADSVFQVKMFFEQALWSHFHYQFNFDIYSQYKETKTKEEYIQIALEAAKKVLETRTSLTLPIMNKKTRLLIHQELLKIPNITTKSVTENQIRLMSIIYKPNKK